MTKYTTFEKMYAILTIWPMTVFLLGILVGQQGPLKDMSPIEVGKLVYCMVLIILSFYSPIIVLKIAKRYVPEFYGWLDSKEKEHKEIKAAEPKREQTPSEKRATWVSFGFLVASIIIAGIPSMMMGKDGVANVGESFAWTFMGLLLIELALLAVWVLYIFYASEDWPKKHTWTDEDRRYLRPKIIGSMILCTVEMFMVAVLICFFAERFFADIVMDSEGVLFLGLATYTFLMLFFAYWMYMALNIRNRYLLRTSDDPSIAFASYLFDKRRD